MCLCINVLSICAFVCEYEDVASAGTMRLLNPGELQDAVGNLQKFTWGVRQSKTRLTKYVSPISVIVAQTVIQYEMCDTYHTF
jgi:hypothetical protein